jgi:WD40 repeat protein
MDFSPNGNLLVSGSSDSKIIVWNFETGDVIKTFSGHEKRVNSVAYSKNGKYIASGSDDKSVKLWNAETGLLEKTFQVHYS